MNFKKLLLFCITVVLLYLFGIEKLYALEFGELSQMDKAIILHRYLSRRDLNALDQIFMQYPDEPLVDAINSDGHSLLFRAIHFREKEVVRFLLEAGADVNLEHFQTGRIPIHNSKDPEITQMLANHPAIELETEDRRHLTPLMKHLEYEDLTQENIEVLLEAGANVHHTTPTGRNVLHSLFYPESRFYANLSSKEKQLLDITILNILQIFIDRGVDVNARSTDGVTPLHFAARMNHVSAVRLLIQSGADIDAQDEDYLRTPAMLALDNDSLQAVEVLIAKGTDMDLPNKKGLSLRKKLAKRSDFKYHSRQQLNGNTHSGSPRTHSRHSRGSFEDYEPHSACRETLTARQRKKLRNRRY